MFDKDQVLKLVDNDVDVYRSIVDIYIKEWPEILSDIKINLENKTLLEAEKQAHKLKGNLKNFYADTCIDLAQKLETSCHDQKIEEAIECIKHLEPQCKELEKQLLISFDEI